MSGMSTFVISPRTTVEVNSNHGTLTVKKSTPYGPLKEATYDTILWAEASLQFEDWKEIFTTRESLKRQVLGNMYFISSVWEQNGVRYSGIRELDGSGDILKKTGVNLDNYEWSALIRKKDSINVALYGLQAERGEKRVGSENEFQMWTCKWLVNGEPHVKKGDSVVKYFSEKDARINAEICKPMGKGIKEKNKELIVESEYCRRPSETLQMSMVYFSLLLNIIQKMVVAGCPACRQDPPAPSQEDHMLPGCCLEDRERSPELIIGILNKIEVADLVAVYNTVCRFLGIPAQGTAFLAKGCIDYIPFNRVVKVVEQSRNLSSFTNDEIDEIQKLENDPLFTIVIQTLKEMKVADKVIKRMN